VKVYLCICSPICIYRLGISVDKDILKQLWVKLAVNCVMNPHTALFGWHNQRFLRENPMGVECARAVCEEISELCAKSGDVNIPPTAEELVEFTLNHVNSSNRSSMLQDVTAKRPTEVAYLNGWVARRAGKLGLKAPVNAHLARLVRAVEYDNTTCT